MASAEREISPRPHELRVVEQPVVAPFLSDIPSSILYNPPEWVKALDETSAHEVGHGFIADHEGADIAYLSVKRTHQYLGITVLAGVPPPPMMRRIAAGGAAGTPFGAARGDGSDRATIHRLGGSHEDINHARNTITSIKYGRIHTLVARILSYKRKLTGTEFKMAIKRAEWELARSPEEKQMIASQVIEKPAESTYTGEVTEIRHLVNGETEVAIREVRELCMYCSGQGDHRPDCPAKQEQVSTGKNEQPEPVQTLQKPVPMTRREMLLHPKQPAIVVFPGPTVIAPAKKVT